MTDFCDFQIKASFFGKNCLMHFSKLGGMTNKNVCAFREKESKTQALNLPGIYMAQLKIEAIELQK